MNIQNICELLDRFEHSNLSELELELEGSRVMMKKQTAGQVLTAASTLPESQSAAQTKAEAPSSVFASEAAKELKAPLAGVFYAAPAPEAEPFVTVGQKIHKGDVIGIIEAMKLMNEVTADADGIVQEITAEDGKLVAYDEVLMRYV